MTALGIFLVFTGLFMLVFFGMNWGEITMRDYEETFMRWIVIAVSSLFLGAFLILKNRKRKKTIVYHETITQ